MEKRVDYEISHLGSEADEISELISSLRLDEQGFKREESGLNYDLVRIDRELQPYKNKLTTLISSDVAAIDTERGRIGEQIENWKRIKESLGRRDALNKKIDTSNKRIAELEAELALTNSDINYEEASSWLDAGMANYLNALTKNNPDRWNLSQPILKIWDRGFSIQVNNGKWDKKIGGATKLYFFLAYHYGLLSLTEIEQCHYPGLLIMDFHPELPDKEHNIAHNESYVIEPFVELCKKSKKMMQVIITGNSFQEITDVNKINLPGTYVKRSSN